MSDRIEINVNSYLEEYSKANPKYKKNDLTSNQTELAHLVAYVRCMPSMKEFDNMNKTINEINKAKKIEVEVLSKGCKDCPYRLQEKEKSKDNYNSYCLINRGSFGKVWFNDEGYAEKRLDGCKLVETESKE